MAELADALALGAYVFGITGPATKGSSGHPLQNGKVDYAEDLLRRLRALGYVQ